MQTSWLIQVTQWDGKPDHLLCDTGWDLEMQSGEHHRASIYKYGIHLKDEEFECTLTGFYP